MFSPIFSSFSLSVIVVLLGLCSLVFLSLNCSPVILSFRGFSLTAQPCSVTPVASFCLFSVMWIPCPHLPYSSLLGLPCQPFLLRLECIHLEAKWNDATFPCFFTSVPLLRYRLPNCSCAFLMTSLLILQQNCFFIHLRYTTMIACTDSNIQVTQFFFPVGYDVMESRSLHPLSSTLSDLCRTFVDCIAELWLLLCGRNSLNVQILSSCLHLSLDSFVAFGTSHCLLSVFGFTSFPFVAGTLSLFLP